MRKSQARFLGEGRAATLEPYPTLVSVVGTTVASTRLEIDKTSAARLKQTVSGALNFMITLIVVKV